MTPARSLLFAARDRKHRPASHPLLRSVVTDHPLTETAYFHAIGQNIRIQREARGWSQKRLGQAIERTAVMVCKWETDQNRPDAYIIDRLERLFGARLRP